MAQQHLAALPEAGIENNSVYPSPPSYASHAEGTFRHRFIGRLQEQLRCTQLNAALWWMEYFQQAFPMFLGICGFAGGYRSGLGEEKFILLLECVAETHMAQPFP